MILNRNIKYATLKWQGRASEIKIYQLYTEN